MTSERAHLAESITNQLEILETKAGTYLIKPNFNNKVRLDNSFKYFCRGQRDLEVTVCRSVGHAYTFSMRTALTSPAQLNTAPAQLTTAQTPATEAAV